MIAAGRQRQPFARPRGARAVTQFDEKLTQIQAESFREGKLARRRVGAALLGVLFRLGSLRRRR